MLFTTINKGFSLIPISSLSVPFFVSAVCKSIHGWRRLGQGRASCEQLQTPRHQTMSEIRPTIFDPGRPMLRKLRYTVLLVGLTDCMILLLLDMVSFPFSHHILK